MEGHPQEGELGDLHKFLETEEEWENVAEITPNFSGENRFLEAAVGSTVPAISSPLASLQDVYQYLNSGVLDVYLAQVIDPPKTSIDLLFNCICNLRPLPPHVEQTKQTILASALIPFINEEKLHLSVLRTLYRQLTGSKLDCPRYGHHWEDIGFQGNDPSTDLRGVGFLGIVQALYMVITPEILPFAKDVYKLSLKESQEFPLMVLSLNVTRICLHVLRDGLLDKQCYKDSDCWSAINYLYAAVMYHIYHVWKTQHKTISNSGFVLKDAEEAARKSPKQLVDCFTVYLTNYSGAEKQAARDQILRDTQIDK